MASYDTGGYSGDGDGSGGGGSSGGICSIIALGMLVGIGVIAHLLHIAGPYV